ncbi:hypothetical protein N9I87_02720 [Gammaproteobacteria bacterium]|nr:hypothetical protein [Gammaproteobacteria bacterium]
MIADIYNAKSGSEALCNILRNASGTVYLPSDICSSVVDAMKQSNRNFKFYSVTRGWDEESDKYELIKSINDDGVYVVSDLFNFRSIQISYFRGRRIILDLAHCSFSTSDYYLKKILKNNLEICLLGLIFSFGAGKYLRLGGGGCSVGAIKGSITVNYGGVTKKLTEMYGPKELKYTDVNVVSELFDPHEIYTSIYSTRMIVRPKNYEKSCCKIDELRKQHNVDISDGLHDQLTDKKHEEFYVWKGIVK